MIVIASNNVKKACEMQQIFVRENITTVLQSDFNVPEIVESGLTFVENAILKARNASRYAKMPAIGDDSGLEVAVLSGRPGIYSARFAGANATDQENIAKLLQELHAIPESERQAQFQCVMVFLRFADDPSPIICCGTWRGKIVAVPQGTHGFGYDPIFWLPEFNCTAAQLESTIKNEISHRAKATKKMAAILKKSHLIK